MRIEKIVSLKVILYGTKVTNYYRLFKKRLFIFLLYGYVYGYLFVFNRTTFYLIRKFAP